MSDGYPIGMVCIANNPYDDKRYPVVITGPAENVLLQCKNKPPAMEYCQEYVHMDGSGEKHGFKLAAPVSLLTPTDEFRHDLV